MNNWPGRPIVEALRYAQQADAEIDRQLANVDAALSALTNAKLYADGYKEP